MLLNLFLRKHSSIYTSRVWWLFAVGLCVFGCISLIINVYNKWQQSPVIVSFAEKSTPVWEIPFPAVTICPETKSYVKELNFTKMYHLMMEQQKPPYNATDEEVSKMEVLAQICDDFLTDSFELGQNFTDSDIIESLIEMAPTFNDTMFICKFRNKFINCSDSFVEVMTEEGLCFTFNDLNIENLYTDEISGVYRTENENVTKEYNWNLENGYDASVAKDTYPHRVFGSGARVGLFVVLMLYKQDLEYICRGPVQGFKILLHTPGEVPQVSKHYLRIPLEQEVLISVKPNMITTSEGLRHYAPNKRQCYFNGERKLRFFKVYTQRNCELECLSNFTNNYCGCVKFSMPHDNSTNVCGASKILCYNEAEDNLLTQDFLQGLGSYTDRKKGCNCLPACTSITYDAEISQAKFEWEQLFEAFQSSPDEFPGMMPSRLSIFFKEQQFITSKRSELYGITDFLANCGGLLGLFMGFSILSIIEMIYYCTLRLYCNLSERKNRKRKMKNLANNLPKITIDDVVKDRII